MNAVTLDQVLPYTSVTIHDSSKRATLYTAVRGEGNFARSFVIETQFPHSDVYSTRVFQQERDGVFNPAADPLSQAHTNNYFDALHNHAYAILEVCRKNGFEPEEEFKKHNAVNQPNESDSRNCPIMVRKE